MQDNGKQFYVLGEVSMTVGGADIVVALGAGCNIVVLNV
jgi:hypothetical protein